MTAAPAIKLSGMNIVDKTIDEAIIAEPRAQPTVKPTSNTRTIEEISAELNAEWISGIIAHMAESARRNPDARIADALFLADIAERNPMERPAIAAILADLDKMTPGLMDEVTTAIPGWSGTSDAEGVDASADPDPDPDHPLRVESPRQNLAEPPKSDPIPNFPSELKKEPNFVRWNLERDGDGRLTKVPYQAKAYTPTTYHVASSTNPSTWATFAEICCSLQETGTKISQTHGIGFALGKNGCGFTVVDLDGCRNPKTGEIARWAQDFMAAHQTYYETSPSGFGFHGVFRGQPILPNGKMIEQWQMPELSGIRDAGYDKAKTELEIFTGKKYVTVTGDVYGDVLAVADYDGFLTELPKKEPKAKLPCDAQITKTDLSDTEKFKLLFDGKWEEVKKEKVNGLQIRLVQTYGSQSEADCGFCTLLAYKHGNDPDAIDEEFRESGLYRDKWERDDYREDTIQKGIEFAASHPNSEKNLTQFRHTDTGNAERLVKLYGEDFRYLHDVQKWLHWDGQRWNPDQTAEIHRAAKETVRAMHTAASSIQDDAMRQKFAGWAARSESRGSRENMVALAQKEPEFSALCSQFDTNPMLLNVMNGTLDLKTFQLRPHRREDLLTKRCPVNFDPSAKSPRWLAFLQEIFPGQPEVIEFLQRSIGYSLTGDTEEQCFWLLIGVGKNGKSKFLDAIQFLMGDYAVATSFDTFAFKKDGAGINPRDGMATLVGSRIVRASESDDGKRLSEAQIKALTGGERIRTARLYQDDFDYKPTFKIWLSTNHVPVIRGTDEGIWRRVNRIDFNVVVPEEKRDRHLGAKLEAEASGILNWALEGLRQYQASGLKVPKAVIQATTQYREEQNLVARFLEECTEKAGVFESVEAAILFRSFKNWAEDGSEFKLSQTKFGVEAKKLLTHKKTSAGVVYVAIKMKTAAATPVLMEVVEDESPIDDDDVAF